jgi:branched-chain amino acid transport system substrate-binding protein
MAAMNLIEKADVVMISPTTSTEILSGLDDHFFRVAGPTSTEGRLLARHVSQNRGRIKICVIFDTDNAAYTLSCWEAFSTEHKKRGGRVVGQWGFSSSQRPDFNRILSEVRKAAPDAVLIIASALDTALIGQRIRAIEPDTILYSSAWGLTDELLQNGGRAVEHIEGVVFFNPDSQNSDFLKFKSQYLAKFGRIPTFADSAGYEAMTLLAEALKETKGRAVGLLKAIKEIQKFEGLMGTINMDEFGDAVRTYFIQRAENGEFVAVPSINP